MMTRMIGAPFGLDELAHALWAQPPLHEKDEVFAGPSEALEWFRASAGGEPVRIWGRWGWVESYEIAGCWAWLRVIWCNADDVAAHEARLRQRAKDAERQQLEGRLAAIERDAEHVRARLAELSA